ncbi:MAG: hypothetical protein A2Z91_06470 [Deltaproteobacteria bacterium GWA2_38_16]|nr:MAG: hypothetical protein A2Z91_06470 [Deltaproteobacteria bacterium GWA2_38_16]OGQ03438.1 MAG: hypothetical protein A3D19_04940 [Deltaproteobacteria bacterium RIFCSPHIGHO2_02_FULL_38_15]OGQ30109.1 MAG: hypothetical protein A3A72_07010 [Deltaproteobacteria bacterium RIFCSPLOWO2_01_FULL_38_9]OGQ59273.1 MAG: hypothetical protein A3G92_01495 [Deltaproteobacteria bacterium RIFCSPLOWO2_12_FULL_38_8]HBQ21350.1 hypothetical protein [Deltaproteobacteria bacterium]
MPSDQRLISNNLLILFIFLIFSGLGCGSSQGPSSSIMEPPPVDPVNINALNIPDGPQNFLLSVGGGYHPKGSQVVLEKNLKIVHELASDYQRDPEFSYYLFGAGRKETDVDVQVLTPSSSEEEELLSALFKSPTASMCTYRHNELGDILNGSANKKNIQDIIHHVATKSIDPMNDKFRFYFSGHGSPKNPEDKNETFEENIMALWMNDNSMDVQEFTRSLDELPSDMQTQVVMVQCYSGGFAQINYEGGIKKNSLSSHNRCGFFSQLSFLPAAGCTPDVTQREEYSTYFFSAYRGEDEKGNPVNADYNRDGKITSNEAHAYTVIYENSIDIPVTTSSELLRDQDFDFSDLAKNISLQELWNEMSPSEKAITQGLTKKLGISINNSWTSDALLQEKNKVHIEKHAPSEENYNTILEQFLPLREELQSYFQSKHEFFKSAPSAISFGPSLAYAPQESVKIAMIDLRNHPSFEKFKNLKQELDTAADEEDMWLKLERKWLRLIFLVNTKLSERKLEESTNITLKEKYLNLKTCEETSFF